MAQHTLPKLAALFLGIGISATSFAAEFHFEADHPYLSFDDSPFRPLVDASGFDYWVFEDFQDNSVDFGPGVSTQGSASNYGIFSGAAGGLSDSVEFTGDPATGRTFFGAGLFVLDFTTGPGQLENLPTHAGLVWTDSATLAITFEAFDANGLSLGTVTGNHADGTTSGTTGEDRFYGVTHPGGLSRITLTSNGGAQELDHIQFGYAVPEPEAVWLALGALLAGSLHRHRRPRAL